MLTWLAFLGYSAAVLVVGLRSRSDATNRDDFWTAGRSLGGWAAGLSLSAGFMSISWSCVYAIQMYYWYGLTAFWLMTAPWLVSLWGIYRLARRYRSLPAFSQPEMVEIRFGRAPAVVVSVTLVAVFLIWGGAEIHVAGTLLGPDLGLRAELVMVLVAAIVAVYSTSGGLAAVVRTDRAQFAVVAVYLLVVAGIGLWSLDGELTVPRPARASGPWFDPSLLPLILITAAAYIPGWLSEADLWVRIQAARDARAARRGALIGLVNALLFVGVVPATIAFAALVRFPPGGDGTPAAIGEDGEGIVAALTASDAALPWLSALLALGLITAAMSTIDTCANVVALTIGRDLLRVRTPRGSRVVNMLVVVASLLVALSIDSLWDVFYLSSGLLTTVVAIPVLGSVVGRVGPRGALFSAVGGGVVTVIGYWLQASGRVRLPGDTGLEYLVLGLVAALTGLAVGSVADRVSATGGSY